MDFAILTDEISLNLDEALEEGERLGFRKYELRCIDSYEHRVPNFKSGVEDRLCREIEKKEIEFTALTPGVFKIPLSETEKIRHEMEVIFPRTCEMANRLGAPRVIVFSFMRNGGGDTDEAISLLKEAGQIAQQFDLQLSVENEPGFFCDTGTNTAKLVQSIDADNVGINWDPANAVVAGEAAYPVGYDAIRPYIQNVHIKDAIPIPPDKWENRLIGDGGVNWLGQLRVLINDAPVSHVTLETHVFPVLESTRANVKRLKILMNAIEAQNQTE